MRVLKERCQSKNFSKEDTDMPKQIGKLGKDYDQINRVYSTDDDSPTIPTPAGGGAYA